ncbi:MAG: hypothetical protein ACXAE3_11725 [Candidatus Kariarchaeaceae archaeon]|jgi:hypothetical protein
MRYLIPLVILALITSLSPAPVIAQQDALYVEPSVFYIVDPESDFPPVTPLGIVEDAAGNIHSWFFYVEPFEEGADEIFIQIYFQTSFTNGSTELHLLNRESVINTRMYFLQKLDLVTTVDGVTFGIYVRTTDFDSSLMQFGWTPQEGFFQRPLSISGTPEFEGHIIGPLQEGNQTSFYLAASTQGTFSTVRRLYEVVFDNAEFAAVNNLLYPTIPGAGQFERLFDIVRQGNSTYYLGSEPQNPSTSFLRVVNITNGNATNHGRFFINAKPAVAQLAFFTAILQDLIIPQLEITESGELYSFFFSLSEELPLRLLVNWTNSTALSVFPQGDDTFTISFFPTIQSYGDAIRISSLGIQLAQDVFSITADLFTYNTTTDVLTRQKFEDPSYSLGFFLFVMDLDAEVPLALISTFSTPSYILDSYEVLNKTVGSLFILSTEELPRLQPSSIGVLFEVDLPPPPEPLITRSLLITILSLLGLVFTISFYGVRRAQLRMPASITRQVEKARSVPRSTSRDQVTSQMHRFGIYLKTNRRRITVSIFILILPSLLVMTMFVGMFSHQDYLIYTYENQNPLNDNPDLSFEVGDFVWTRSLYNDELANNTIANAEWEIPRQLSKIAVETFDVNQTVAGLSTTTIFPLFEKHSAQIINEQGQNQTLLYPVPRNFAVIDRTWTSFLESQLVRGRLPTASNEIMIQESWYTQRDPLNATYPFGNIWDEGSTIEFHASELDIFFNTSIAGLSQDLTVVGVIQKVESLQFDDIKQWAIDLGTTVSSLRLLDAIPFYTTPSLVSPMLNNFTRLSLRPTSFVDVRYNVFDIERDTIPDVVDSYTSLGDIILQETGFAWLGNFTDDRIVPFLEGYFDASREIQLESSILIIPALGLILLLTYEALGIGRALVEEELTRFKREGLRFEQVLQLAFLERFLHATVATALATVVLQPVVGLLVALTDFFQLTPALTPPVLTGLIPGLALINLGILTLLGLYQTMRIYFRSDTWLDSKISGFQQDLLLMMVAVVLFGIASGINSLFEDQLTSDENLDSTSAVLILALRLISLLVMSFTAVLLFTKIINRLYTVAGGVVWRTRPSKYNLTAKGIGANMAIYGKGMLVFAIAIFLIIPMIIVPGTLSAYYTDQAYYELGADIHIQESNTIDTADLDAIRAHPAVVATSDYFFGEVVFARGIAFRILAIDPSTFFESTTIPDAFASSFGFDREIVRNLGDFDIVTNEEFTKRNPLGIGDNFTLTYPQHSLNHTFFIREVYDQFPILKFELTGLDNPELIPLQMVITLATLSRIQEMYQLNSTEITADIASSLDARHTTLTLTDRDAEDEVADFIKELTGAQLRLLSTTEQGFRHPFFRLFEFIAHLSLIIALLAPLLASLILANVIFQRRKLELEVYRRNGISHLFFLAQMSVELILASILPGLLGFRLGTWWTIAYGAQLFGEEALDLPWTGSPLLIYGLVAGMIVASLIIWVSRIFVLSQRHIKEVRI